MAISRHVNNAHLSFWCHCKALGWTFFVSKYQLSRVNSYFSIEKNAIPDISQKVPKNEEFWMNGNISMQQIKDKAKHKKMKNCNFKWVLIKETSIQCLSVWKCLFFQSLNPHVLDVSAFGSITICSRRSMLAQTLIKTSMVTVWIAALIRIFSWSIL